MNEIFREYSTLDPELRRDMNFNRYLEILGIKGGHTHHMQSSSHSWGNKRDLHQKLNKMQVPMYDGQKVMGRAWLQQFQTYFSLSPNMVEEDAIHFASLHFEGDALEWWRHKVISQNYSTSLPLMNLLDAW